ncbi:MAG: DUF4160 domain-containing protein [Bacteroidetes bacterium]|nr:DUF4160 domain-containing protein [Fibrella sp.]
MPKLVIYGKLVFYIFAYDLSERMHVHISNTKSREGRSAKIWLDTLVVFEQGSLTNKEIKLALRLLEEHNAAIQLSIRTFAETGQTKPLHLR